MMPFKGCGHEKCGTQVDGDWRYCPVCLTKRVQALETLCVKYMADSAVHVTGARLDIANQTAIKHLRHTSEKFDATKVLIRKDSAILH